VIPLTVVTGFLGAGKTTLVNRWLAEAPRGEIAVIVNEYGAVGIDGELLASAAAARVRSIVEIAGGCVCCSTQEELARALDELAASGAKRILIETSGAASPAGVIRVISGREACVLDGVITVVDGSRLGVLDEHELAMEQVGYADVVVVSRGDVVEDVDTTAIESLNGAAVVVTGPTSLEDLLDQRRADFVRKTPPAVTSHRAYESIALVHDGELDGDRFADFMETDLAQFGGRLLRTKGILAVEGVAERMIVQGVADLAEVTFGEPWGSGDNVPRRSSRFVIVGFGLDREALTKAFLRCATERQ